MRVRHTGLDAAGKTTILYKLKLGDIVTTIPTIGELLPTVHAQCIHTDTQQGLWTPYIGYNYH